MLKTLTTILTLTLFFAGTNANAAKQEQELGKKSQQTEENQQEGNSEVSQPSNEVNEPSGEAELKEDKLNNSPAASEKEIKPINSSSPSSKGKKSPNNVKEKDSGSKLNILHYYYYQMYKHKDNKLSSIASYLYNTFI